MPKHLLVKPKYRQLIMHCNIIFGIFLALSACRDLVKKSDTGACNSAIDSRNYNEALTVCTSRKDRASAYMGMAGYDIINLLKSSGTSTKPYTDPTTGDNLGIDDSRPASILNILQLSDDVIANYDTRAAAISSSKSNLDKASGELQDYLYDNSSPLTTDEILLNTFAISFAMQLDQIMLFDNKTTSQTTSPVVDGTTLTCNQVSDYNSADAEAVLIAMDGHIWAAERDGMMCINIKKAYDQYSGNKTTAAAAIKKWAEDAEEGTEAPLPDPFQNLVCPQFISLTTYLTNLALNIVELKKTISLSGDNTKAITKADNSTNELMKAVGCYSVD